MEFFKKKPKVFTLDEEKKPKDKATVEAASNSALLPNRLDHHTHRPMNRAERRAENKKQMSLKRSGLVRKSTSEVKPSAD